MDKQLQKYLRTRAITCPWELTGTKRSDFRAAIIIPALAEYNRLPKTLLSLAANPSEYLKQTLIVVVVNNRVEVALEQFQENQRTLSWLASWPYRQLNLAWVDASSAGLELPAKDGVGLARKIGFDLALPLLDGSAGPLLISLDADTLVQPNYLQAIYHHFQASNSGGGILPFRHQQGEDQQQETAIRNYELYLRSYLFGLEQAGSPYAYHSIGSAIACRAQAYLRAGGMNRRQAAEDFYFLQQLAKTTGVSLISGTVVAPAPRHSDRVPFGTGKAVKELVCEGKMLYRFTSLAAFKLLQAWLRLIESNWGGSSTQILQQVEGLSPRLTEYLTTLDFCVNWAKICRNHCAFEQRQQAFHCWFDGLRTRQLLAQFDADVAVDPVGEVAELLSWGGYPDLWEGKDQLRQLEKLQGV